MPSKSLRAMDRQLTLGFAGVLVLLLGLMFYAQSRVEALDEATRRVDHTYAVVEAIRTVDGLLADAEAGEEGYLLTGLRPQLTRFQVAANDVDGAVAQLRELTGNDPVQQRRLDTLQRLAAEQLAARRDEISRYEQGGRAARAGGTLRDGAGEAAALYHALSTRMASAERALLRERTAARDTQQRHLSIAMLIRNLAAILVVITAVWRVRAALAERADAEAERDAHADALQRQSLELEAQNEELIAQGEALQAAMDQVEGANRAKSNFLAQMSHELRTPLNSVIGFANILLRDPRGTLNATDVTYLDRIAENGRQLLHTINSILDLSKIEAEQESVELEMVALGSLVQEVIAQLEPQATAGQVALTSHVPAPLASIVTDTEKFRRVLINLVANAVKFTKAGGRVTVRVETAARAPTTAVAIEVRDTGIGIAPDRLAAIFEAFEQGDVGVGREFGGTGLGLSISRALCRLLHCELTVSSALGEGSVFRIDLPRGGALASPVSMQQIAELGTAART